MTVATEAWLPIGFVLPDGSKAKRTLWGDRDWQIVETQGHGRALLAKEELARRWLAAGLVDEDALAPFAFGDFRLRSLSSPPSQKLDPVSDCPSPGTKSEALAFAMALKATRDIDAESHLQDAVYAEKLTRLLPTYGISDRVDDDVVLGFWLTGGARVSAKAFRRLSQTMSWLRPDHLKDVVSAAGFEVSEEMPQTEGGWHEAAEGAGNEERARNDGGLAGTAPFSLPGRPVLENFFNEHVVDIVRNAARYKALGIDFPSAVVLHGPPGCGKTFAVDRLVDFLGWPSFGIDASSVASPYIHETSRKVAEVFEKAMKNAPSVLVIDEMEAFLADRESGGGGSHHRVEEVAEFLRRIPEATKNQVLIVAMTNRVEMIDSAIMRRGRFDHVIKVDYASEEEVRALLDKLLSTLPKDGTVEPAPLANKLAGRPLSDVSFVVREGARLSARAGKDRLSAEHLMAALDTAPARDEESGRRRIGFV